jgi:hypothetical protein
MKSDKSKIKRLKSQIPVDLSSTIGVVWLKKHYLTILIISLRDKIIKRLNHFSFCLQIARNGDFY